MPAISSLDSGFLVLAGEPDARASSVIFGIMAMNFSLSIPYSSGVGIWQDRHSSLQARMNRSAASMSPVSLSATPMALPRSAKRSAASLYTYSKHPGSSMALLTPWGTWNKAPMGRLIPWITVTEALLKAIPASSAAKLICILASRSSPWE